MIYSPNGLMRYNDSVAIVDDMPLLSQWIKNPRSTERGFFVSRVRKRTGEKPLILLGFPRFSLRIYYNIKRHSLQHKNAESSLEIYNDNTKQTLAKLQPL